MNMKAAMITQEQWRLSMKKLRAARQPQRSSKKSVPEPRGSSNLAMRQERLWARHWVKRRLPVDLQRQRRGYPFKVLGTTVERGERCMTTTVTLGAPWALAATKMQQKPSSSPLAAARAQMT